MKFTTKNLIKGILNFVKKLKENIFYICFYYF